MLHHNQVDLALRLTVAEGILSRHTPASAKVVGEALAEQIQSYTAQQKPGYYPPVDFFEQHGGVDPELLETLNGIAWLSARLVRNETLAKLRPVFSQVRIESVQCLAFAMPGVRPNDPDALTKLAAHYTPDTVKMDLRVSLLQKQDQRHGLERFARHVVMRWLRDSFAGLEITGSKIV